MGVMRRYLQTLVTAPTALLCLTMPLIAGCDGGFLLSGFNSPDSGNPFDGDREPTSGRSNVVTVRFSNLTTQAAVNVGFFSMGDSSAVVPDELFTEENALTRDIGLAGTGILPPNVSDSVDIPCGTNLIIGTSGGAFVDPETGDELGKGTRRWASENPLGFCGAVVTFEYVSLGGSFDTRISIHRP